MLFAFSNIIHERVLRLVYGDSTDLSSDELLIKDKSVSIHQRNLQFLLIKIVNVKNGASTGLTQDIFQFVDKPYYLQNNRILLGKKGQSFFFGSKHLEINTSVT